VQASDPLTLPPTPAPRLVCGSLIDQRLPAADERRALSARLRLSWPARRFRLPRNTPLWAWQLLHLLGLAEEGARLHLVTPGGWLTSEFGRQLLPLIYEVATPEHVEQQARTLTWHLVKESRPEAQVLLQCHAHRLSTSWQRLRTGHPALLALLIELPEELHPLLEDGRLRIPARETWPDTAAEGIFLFTRSSLGRYLWQVVGGGRPLPRQRALQNELCRRGLPLPGNRVLASLQRLAEEESAPVGQGELDRELALWLDLPRELPATDDSSCNADEAAPDQAGPDNLDETIADQVFVDGIPLFPEHYLYDYYRPELIEHAVAGPLQIDGEFFDAVTLRTVDNRTLQVEGRETARALVLISAVRSGPVALPADRRITAVILERYLDDLRRLRHELIREVFRHQSNAQTAEALVAKLWQEHKLPPWHMVSGA
jgi:hypothetical protein